MKECAKYTDVLGSTPSRMVPSQSLSSGTVSSFHPTCGIRCGVPSAPVGGMAATMPGISPSPSCTPNSSLWANNICMPRQIPSNGPPFSTNARTGSTKPQSRMSAMESAKAPTPGKSRRSAFSTACGEELSSGSAPQYSRAPRTLNRLPTP